MSSMDWQGFMALQRPKLQDYTANPRAYPAWMVCPRCHGGRGEMVVEQPEEGEPYIQIQVCALCNGERLMLRVS